ncbi:MAG: hypothetical protein P8X94_00940 [Woeseiaceae bacterium]
MNSFSLTFKAGAGALAAVRRHGFDVASIGTLAGASGGPKWLVLSQLDRAIMQSIVPGLTGPVHLIGSSIGSWRFACYAQADPLAAIERFEAAYLAQSYSEKPDIHEISRVSREILAQVLGTDGVAEILGNPVLRTHIMAVRSRHILASENRGVLALGLVTAALLNAVSRSTLGWFFERALFYDQRDTPPFFDVEAGYGRIVPGWFDKKLRWRRPQVGNVDRTILISPSDEFVSKLPNGKIPDRTDFVNYEPAERIRIWRRCIADCRALADEFLEVIEKDQLAARLEPLW